MRKIQEGKTIHEIEAMTIEKVDEYLFAGMAEYELINDHECFFVDFDGAFGYSVLVFRNDRHIKYADDFQLHHSNKSAEELKKYYIEQLKRKLFDDEQFFKPCQNYDDYEQKLRYAIDLWVYQFHNVSAFYIGEPSEEQERAKKEMVFDRHGMCYVDSSEIVERHGQLFEFLEKELSRLMADTETFAKIIRYELQNHESCYSHDFTDALASLGLSYNNLTEEQKKIVNHEQYLQEMRTDI